MNVRVIVAEADAIQRAAMAEALASETEFTVIGQSGNGLEALKLIRNSSVDVLVCSMQLTGIDGCGILEKIAELPPEKHPLVIMVSAVAREFLMRRAFDLGAADFMLKPFEPQVLVKRIRRIFMHEAFVAHTPSENHMERVLSRILLQCGIPPHMSGYRFLQEAVRESLRRPQMMEHLMHDLYPRVAKSCHSTTCGVEYAIRQAISMAWERGRPEVTSKIFGRNVSPGYEKPTSGELIALVVEKMRAYL